MDKRSAAHATLSDTPNHRTESSQCWLAIKIDAEWEDVRAALAGQVRPRNCPRTLRRLFAVGKRPRYRATGGAPPFRCGFYLYAVFRGVIGSVCLLGPAPLRSAVIAAGTDL